MLGNLKKVLGIEGLKLEVVIPGEVQKETGIIRGHILLSTLRDTSLTGISIKVMEKYARGKGENLKVNEYLMGQMKLNKTISVRKDEFKKIDFEVPFHFAESEMDKWQDQNFLFRGLIKVAKKLHGVKSEYFVLVEADETGAKLSPHVKKIFLLT